ncbi:EamA family transporter [Streptacidiphilus monticola]|uniref:EamA family transporter n=1 Tax=Streptacidiphilus monticola TaxID=2161674 RepID=A0ABW1G0Q8_9ACTN
MNTRPASSRTLLLATTALAPVTWGSTYAVTTSLLPADRPLLAAAVRALPAGLVLLAFVRRLPRGSWWARAAVLGVLNIGAFFPLLFLAAYRLPGGVAGVLGAVQPLVVAGLSVRVLGQRPGARTLAAGLLGVVGVALVVLRADAGLDALGVLAGLGGAVSMAAGTVLGRRWGLPPGVGPLALTAWQLTVGGLLLLPLALFAEGLPAAVTGTNLLGYLYLATVNTALGYALWFRGVTRLPAAAASFLGLLSPVTAAVIGWAALGQSLTPLQLTGLAVALGAMAWGAVGGSRSARGAKSVEHHTRAPGAEDSAARNGGPGKTSGTEGAVDAGTPVRP